MPQSRKRKPKKAKSRKPVTRAKVDDPWDFRVNLPIAPVEVLERISPLPPELTIDTGQLVHSPAATYLNVSRQSVEQETIDVLGRWPFRMARPNKRPGPWVCLAQMAYEQGLSIDEVAAATVELEDSRLLVWSSEHHVYVMSHETAAISSTLDGEAAADALFERLNSESPLERSRRRWTTPTVVPVENDNAD